MMQVIAPSNGSQKAIFLRSTNVQFIALSYMIPALCYHHCCKSLFFTPSVLAVYSLLWKNVLGEKILACCYSCITAIHLAVSR